ncbi:hypothetical protein ABB37_07085 [Leptomonas pyrrhocoris]|uniref:Uncharacterized protein n=1 Tax=Leptomonas pyrrhocoris TaxID=157538 RepID=A0A0N0DT92_LEPPY|nr:hypothetical protein ABB37_07085 [Leptomonas pyrrhocoris]XP_015655601.1 hypothetical protein ABB37_07085 [Leptomonas pyrrhocoris]KPA77161.1 hypothetical protein ABB37_07085 [Leptomonas pyrrhocoris]KPA77162.1 hypothetical protein ABB37_07085 [Leptomonas pyrrhocoris]|eukprot:XP_015655600.1 hypothetical protein ABB37_07085 [Leptomonas pyrrhocoris]
MPQLQQLADRRAAASQKMSEEKPWQPSFALPSDALPLRPPVPTSVLFNVADGYAYQITISPFDDAAQLSVCVFTVRRVVLPDTHVLSLQVSATARCGLPFCTVEGGVTWHDVLVTLALVEPQLRASLYGWNVQVLGLDARSGGWLPITPALSSPLEAQYFLQTNVEVLFEYYGADSLHMQATPLMPSPAAADWHTPSERSTTPGQAPPPAPVKDYHRAPPHVCFSDPRRYNVRHPNEAGAAAPPRSLAYDFDAARTPSPQSAEDNPVAPPVATWSLVAFLRQQQRWGQRCKELRQRTANMPADAVLQLVRDELQLLRQPQSLPCTVLEDRGAATWTLSLLEYECQLLSEKVHDLCRPAEPAEAATTPPPTAEVLRTCRAHLRHIRERAAKVCQVVDAVWTAERQAEVEGAVPDDFPLGWLCVLLTSLRLRCLRHVALVHACTGFVSGSENEEDEEAAKAVDAGDFLSTAMLGSDAVLLHESVQTAEQMLEALESISAFPQDARLPPAALSEPLLATALSLAELAAYLSVNTANRCALVRAAVQLCRVRLQCIAPSGDVRWLPRCIQDIATRMQGKLNGLPLTSTAFAAYAELTQLLRDAADSAAELNAAAEEVPSSTTPPDSSMMVLGYTLTHLATTADVDTAFVQGNMAVRGFRSNTAAPESVDPRTAEVTQEDTQTAQM